MVGMVDSDLAAPVEPSATTPLVLVVDDDPDTCALARRWLERDGFRVETHPSAEALLEALRRTLPDVVCLDLGLPGMDGMEALGLVRARHRTVPVIIFTADDSVDRVVEAMQGGAADFVAKPPDRAKLLAAVRNAHERHELSMRVAHLEREAGGGFPGIIGRSAVMRELFRQLEKVAASDITVLVHGESGSGKELVAKAVHDHSARCNGPFVAVNCAAIAESLQDSELFGHEKGAFTGATQARPGRFEQAHGGTLFLDEVGELSASVQAKLLRVLQERRFERLGGTKTLSSDFRLVAATHRDLREMAGTGAFREDLYFRLAVMELEVPPLRRRDGDLPLLVEALLDRIHEEHGGARVALSRDAWDRLEAHDWPGNVRELHNTLQRAVVVAEGGVVTPRDLPERMRVDPVGTAPNGAPVRPTPSENGIDGPVASRAVVDAPESAAPDPARMSLAELERWAIEQAMTRTQGNIAEVVRSLGIGRTTLYRKLKEYGTPR